MEMLRIVALVFVLFALLVATATVRAATPSAPAPHPAAQLVSPR